MPQDTNIARYIVYDTVVPKLLLRPSDSLTVAKADSNDYLLVCNDSIFAPYAADSLTTYRESMFVKSVTHTSNNEPAMRNTTSGFDWMFFVIMLLLTLISIYINQTRFSLKDILTSLFDQRAQSRVERENNVKIRNLIPMTGIYLASAASIITLLACGEHGVRLTVSLPVFYLATVGVLFLYILLRGGLIRLIGNIFEDSASVQLYLTNNHLFYFVGGILLTPLLLFVYYAGAGQTTALYIAIGIISIVLTIRFIRGIQLILTNSKTSKLYLFYYLCILEIVPILVMAKIIIP